MCYEIPCKQLMKKELKYYPNIYPTKCNVTQFILSGNCSTCFGLYLHNHQEGMQLYLQYLVIVTPLLLPASIVEELNDWMTNTLWLMMMMPLVRSEHDLSYTAEGRHCYRPKIVTYSRHISTSCVMCSIRTMLRHISSSSLSPNQQQ